MPGSGDTIEVDPGKLWFMPRFVEEAEAYFKARIVADKCVSAWGPDHCSVRWHKYGFICFAECRSRIPDYVPPQPGSEPVEEIPGSPRVSEYNKYRFAVAEAYRWAHEQGQTMPKGLNPNGPEVRDLLYRHTEAKRTGSRVRQDRERLVASKNIKSWRDDDGRPTVEAVAYAEICMRQVRENVAQFAERNARAFGRQKS